MYADLINKMESSDTSSTASTRYKMNKIFDNFINIDNSDSQTLSAFSELCIPSLHNSKQFFHSGIEKNDININKAIISEFTKVKSTLDVILDSFKSLHTVVENMSVRLEDSKLKTHKLISETFRLNKEKKKIEMKSHWVNNFIAKFQISPALCKYLQEISIERPLNMELFHALHYVDKLQENSKCLIKCGYQKCGFEILEIVGMQQEAAVEKLYHWTINACQNINSSHFSIVPKALHIFVNRQVLFNNILDEYCVARKAFIIESFINVLVEGSSSTKPIEFYADDAKKYIGDILAWIYKILPLEKENIFNLVKHCDILNKNDLITKCLISIMEGCCSMLKVRTELVLKPDKNPLVLWSVNNSIIYYKNLIQNFIPNGQLIETLNELEQKSEEVFILVLDQFVQKELSYGVKAPPSDLNPSNIVTDLVSFLRDLLAVTNDSNNCNINDKKIITNHILDPLLKAINETACHLSSIDMAVYMLNCIYHTQCTLSLYSLMDEYHERLQAQSEAQIDTLTSEQASYLVANLNLSPIYTILSGNYDKPLSAIPGMDSQNLKMFLNKFNLFITTPEAYILPQLSLLISQNHRAVVKTRAFEVIIAVYSQLYNAVYDSTNGYLEPDNIIKKSPEEVKKLLIS